MGVSEVPGYGPITSGNAKEIYLAWKHGEVELEVSQQKYCEGLLSPSDWDEIDYDTGSNHNEGYEQISDAEKADSHSGQLGNVAGNTIGMAYGATTVVSNIKAAAKGASLSGWVAIAVGAIVAAQGALCVLCAKQFDSGYHDRCDLKDNSENTNATIDSYNEQLQESMDMMNEDMANYDAATQEYTTTVNSTNADLADLQVQLADAEASGDTAGATSIREQIRALQGQGFEGEEEELQGMRDGLEEYKAMGDESHGVADAGTSVSEFLKAGTPLGRIAGVEAALLLVGVAMAAIGAGCSLFGGAKDTAHFDFGGGAAGVAAAVLFAVSGGLLAASAYMMSEKAIKELKCGSAGGEMGDKVDALNDMINQQGGYIEETEGFYGESDEARAEDNATGKDMANTNSTSNDGRLVDADPNKSNTTKTSTVAA